MTFWTVRVPAFVFLVLCSVVLISCTVEYPGISVKTYKEPATVLETREKDQQEMSEAIRRLSYVRENSVFTEKYGFPEYRVGSGDVITINYWVPSPDEGFKQQTYTATVRPTAGSHSLRDDINVDGMTAREIDETLTRLSQRYLRDADRGYGQGIQKQVHLDLQPHQHGSAGGGLVRTLSLSVNAGPDVIITAGGPVAG